MFAFAFERRPLLGASPAIAGQVNASASEGGAGAGVHSPGETPTVDLIFPPEGSGDILSFEGAGWPVARARPGEEKDPRTSPTKPLDEVQICNLWVLAGCCSGGLLVPPLLEGLASWTVWKIENCRFSFVSD